MLKVAGGKTLIRHPLHLVHPPDHHAQVAVQRSSSIPVTWLAVHREPAAVPAEARRVGTVWLAAWKELEEEGCERCLGHQVQPGKCHNKCKMTFIYPNYH